MIASFVALACGAYPTLPTAWRATVKEAEVGVVYESYIMVDKPTETNPSAKWTNFTDGSCQRLIFDGPNYAAMRYLLKCDAVDCCKEEQSGNHVEYQIPNIHPKWLAKVTELGKESITLFNGSSIVADAFRWKVFPLKYTAYTVGSELVRWNVNVEGDNITNDYANFTAIPEDEIAAFQSNFAVPPQCKAPNIPRCDGLVSEKSLKFLRAGGMEAPGKAPRGVLDTCTGPHESCCAAPGDDPNNCPASARTSDCDAKKSCCCG